MGKTCVSSVAGNGLKLAFIVNATFTLLEIAGGVWTNSIAVFTDALHDAGDTLSLGLAWYLQGLATRPADQSYSFGYRRFSLLGAMITGVLLIVGVSLVAWSAWQRLLEPKEVYAPGMALMSVAGIFFNGLAVWMLREGRSFNEKMARWHLAEDMLGWIGILIGSVIMMIWHVPIIDPILSLLIAAFILWHVGHSMKPVFRAMLQGVPPGFVLSDFKDVVEAVPGVLDCHDIRAWTLDGEFHVFSVHVRVKRDVSPDGILRIKEAITAAIQPQGFEHITIETEQETDDA